MYILKILIITQNFYPEIGSAANRITNLYKLLLHNKNVVNILTTTPAYPNKKLFYNSKYFNDVNLNDSKKNRVYRIKSSFPKQSKFLFLRILYFAEEFIKLRRFLRSNSKKYNIIYVTSPNIFLAWGTLFFKEKNIKYILEIRDLWPDSVNHINGIKIHLIMPILKYLEKQMYLSADKIIINTPSFREHINNLTNVNKPILYLPNGINKSEVLNNKKHEEFTVIYTGNLGYAQDVNKLISIAKNLNRKCIKFTAIIYGPKSDYFKNEVKNLSYVNIKKPMPRSECLKEISKAHVSLSILKPSEVFLNVLPGRIIDAICMGTIPVANLGGYTEKILTESNIGISEKNIDTETLINNILNLKHNPNKLKLMRYNTINFRNDNFIWEKNIKYLDYFLKDGFCDE